MAKKALILILLLIIGSAVAAILAINLIGKSHPANSKKAQTPSNAIPALARYNPTGMMKYYKPVEYSVNPSIRGYKLPLSEANLAQFDEELKDLKLLHLKNDLMKYGFAIDREDCGDDFAEFYEHKKDYEHQIFITTDSVLFVNHIVFDSILQSIETDVLSGYLSNLYTYLSSAKLSIPQFDGDPLAAPAQKLVKDYAQVAIALLTDNEPEDPLLIEEFRLIHQHEQITCSPLLHYELDYTMFTPRGHYTESEDLMKYFRSMSWLLRAAFRFKETDLFPQKQVDTQTLAAAYMAKALSEYDMRDEIEKMGNVIDFLIGSSEFISPARYLTALNSTLKSGNPTIETLKFEILRNTPETYLFLNDEEVANIPSIITGRDYTGLLRAFKNKAGMNLFGVVEVPDAEIFQELTYPKVEKFTGEVEPFTMNPRYGASALDVMYTLGSDRAKVHLEEGEMTSYIGYEENRKALSDKFMSRPKQEWYGSVYDGTLFSFMSLFEKTGKGYQPFQQTDRWEDRQLVSALGGWTALKHDTILYSFQGITYGACPPPDRKCMAYVEPEPEFYSRMLSLQLLLRDGLEDLGIPLSAETCLKIDRMHGMLNMFLDISILELEERPLSQIQMDFIENIADIIDETHSEPRTDYPSAIVADILTVCSVNQVIEEAIGNLRTMVVVISNPDGSINLAYGPVFSYYEFYHPMSDRLTDSKWREIMKTKEMPGWVENLSSKP